MPRSLQRALCQNNNKKQQTLGKAISLFLRRDWSVDEKGNQLFPLFRHNNLELNQANASTSANESDGFQLVSRNKYKKREPKVGTLASSNIEMAPERIKTKSLFVSRFSSKVNSNNIEDSLKNQLQLRSLAVTKLKTKYQSYSSFHITVDVRDFDSINNPEVWPAGCLIAPFYGKLKTEQHFAHSADSNSVDSREMPLSLSLARSHFQYRLFEDTNKKRGGGVLTAISNQLPFTRRRFDLEIISECVWVEIRMADGFNLLIANVWEFRRRSPLKFGEFVYEALRSKLIQVTFTRLRTGTDLFLFAIELNEMIHVKTLRIKRPDHREMNHNTEYSALKRVLGVGHPSSALDRAGPVSRTSSVISSGFQSPKLFLSGGSSCLRARCRLHTSSLISPRGADP
ncbi:hypothetical protein ANN_14338 [Periplaneta americana]|uniref:Uncharacterized protein n=1 Tax=Periplaneta americana TaxID=6978 RepID=A0ABQ8SX93_PERAM|nr:hypothetical protein ANN_14338 [Periplaneta americana]